MDKVRGGKGSAGLFQGPAHRASAHARRREGARGQDKGMRKEGEEDPEGPRAVVRPEPQEIARNRQEQARRDEEGLLREGAGAEIEVYKVQPQAPRELSEEAPRQGASPDRPRTGGEPRPDEGRREIRPQEGVQVLDLRRMVDSAGAYECNRRKDQDYKGPRIRP